MYKHCFMNIIGRYNQYINIFLHLCTMLSFFLAIFTKMVQLLYLQIIPPLLLSLSTLCLIQQSFVHSLLFSRLIILMCVHSSHLSSVCQSLGLCALFLACPEKVCLRSLFMKLLGVLLPSTQTCCFVNLTNFFFRVFYFNIFPNVLFCLLYSTPSSLVGIYQFFGGNCFLHLQSRTETEDRISKFLQNIGNSFV